MAWLDGLNGMAGWTEWHGKKGWMAWQDGLNGMERWAEW